MDELQGVLDDIEPANESDSKVTHEVWSLSGTEGTTSRMLQLLDDADEEVIFAVGSPSIDTDNTVKKLDDATERGLDVLIGTAVPGRSDELRDAIPDAEVLVSELDWLHGTAGDDTAIGRMLLVDESTILLSSMNEQARTERAIFGRGFENGLVVITRRLMATGLLSRDPGT
ncbi:transcriptional regulator TrmB [Halorussus sp. MSC15.2]|uniref:transcriptional regulator TrmB n=1 Tax=Halorussus sp. MSC15.2 TaxID=2283638 RepID=UPI001F07ED79|nr:transcriptional regulator TrmB [Halorussus sp. MSC15.2]